MFTVAFEADIKNLHRNRVCSDAPQEKLLAPIHLWTNELESKDNSTGSSFFHLSLYQVLSCLVAEQMRLFLSCRKARKWQFCFAS